MSQPEAPATLVVELRSALAQALALYGPVEENISGTEWPAPLRETGPSQTVGTSSQSPLSGERGQALAITGIDAVQTAELVWKPCAARMSPFYPLWLVADAAHSLFIDQNGQIWPTLPPKRPGG